MLTNGSNMTVSSAAASEQTDTRHMDIDTGSTRQHQPSSRWQHDALNTINACPADLKFALSFELVTFMCTNKLRRDY